MSADSKNQDGSCSCSVCARLCRDNPGWMSPEDASAAIDAGLSRRLMRDWLEPCSEVGNKERIFLLAPASAGFEGRDAPEFDLYDMFCSNVSKGRCTFLKNELCEIHYSGFKPVQCRRNYGCRKDGYVVDNYAAARLWNTEAGSSVLKKWETSLMAGKKGMTP